VVRASSRRPPRGIALPVALLMIIALGMLSALALSDALQAARVATLAEDEALARAAALDGLSRVTTPSDVPWLCLQPPATPAQRVDTLPGGRRVELRWWAVAPGVIRAEVVGVGVSGGRHRRIGWLRPVPVDPDDHRPGCPAAERLEPIGADWLGGHPEG
jgi:hypothetical protein